MIQPPTLFELASASPRPVRLPEAALVLIDYQNEYLSGPLALPGAGPAIDRAVRLLAGARRSNALVVHVAHKGGVGSMFDRAAERGRIIEALSPLEGELVVEKPRPNSFSGTRLSEVLGAAGRPLIIAGFMTHMCVASTCRAALDLGYPVTLAHDACATRDLPAPGGGVISAQALHHAELAALADRFAVLSSVEDLVRPD